jgi:hypothetical protein
MGQELSSASILLPGTTLTYPAVPSSATPEIGLSVQPEAVAIPNYALGAGRSYGLVIVTSSDSQGLLICAGQSTEVHLLQTSDQNGLPIFWSGLINGSSAGWYASLGSYADYHHQLGWYGETSGGSFEHGYSFINRWGSAPFDVGAAAAFHGNPILVKPLHAPTLLTVASTSASKVFVLSPPASGSYTLIINGVTTGAIAATNTPTKVQTILQALPGLSEVTVDGSGNDGSEWPACVTVPDSLGAITTSGATLSEATPLQSGTPYFYVATAVANDGTETVMGSQVSCTPTDAEPSVELVVTQDWGMAYAKVYRSTSDGGPYSLISILNPQTPKLYGGSVGIGALDSGLVSQADEPPTAPTPTPTVWQAWSGEPSTNVKLEGRDFAGTSQWSITAAGTFTGANVGSALKTTPLYNQNHAVVPSATANTQGSPETFSPHTGFSCIFPLGNTAIIGATSDMGSETLTVRVQANYSDSTSQTEAMLFSDNATSEMGFMEFARLIKDGVTITSFNVSVASSIDDSAASVLITIVGTNGL